MQDQERYRDRLNIAKEDLFQARCFGKLILDRDSYEETQDDETRLILSALDIALIVSYCRPFTLFFDKYRKREPELPQTLLGVLNAEERNLHDQLIGRRDQEYAHSDASKADLRYYPWSLGVMTFMRNRFVPLPKSKVAQIVTMSEKLYLKLSDELRGLEAPGDLEKPSAQQTTAE